ncbi:cyclic nucleotide-binding domain-containing protein [Sorangium sp. So ce861]|uniref:cyclic nucleotide-binding domain-containing protein n=1 Tax=Sorangium sp. So ce861 TaxID=3133323 RepID=UPI003F5E1A50
MALPPVLPGSTHQAESPIDRALSLALAGERDAALRWAAALVRHDPTMPSALCLCGRLLGELNRHEAAREACATAVVRAIDLENLPLAVAAARESERFGGDPGPGLDLIAEAFCRDSPRLGEGAPPPPPLPTAEAFQPLASVLTGALLLNKATEIIHDATRRLAAQADHPGIAPQPVFSSVGRDALRALCAAFTPIWVAAGTTVIEQGAARSEAYFVARGELEARRRRGGEEIVLARLTNGAMFGEMALLSRAPRTGSVVATRPSIVLEVKRDAIDEIAQREPEVGLELAAYCRDRMVENLVRMSDVLRVVPDADRPAFVKRFRTRTFEKNERLLVQDERPSGLFLIASGEVAVVRRDTADDAHLEPLVLSTLGPGDVAGEIAMVLRRAANADVIAVHPTVALYLPATEFMGLVEDHPAVLAQLYKLAVLRDEETTSIMAEEVSVAEDFVLI